MEIYIGTSGWYYDWNKDLSLEWYVKNSGLNAIELNASFYKFPFPNQVKAWVKKARNLRWSIKVNRLITHVYKLNSKAVTTWERFYKLFRPLYDNVDFFLFQMPPNFTDIEKVINFYEEINIGKKFALELRNKTILEKITYKDIKNKFILVSVDSPDFINKIFSGKTIYLRMHGREIWYSYNYSEKELEEIASIIKNTKASNVYIFFNNNHDMLNNARLMFRIMKKVVDF